MKQSLIQKHDSNLGVSVLALSRTNYNDVEILEYLGQTQLSHEYIKPNLILSQSEMPKSTFIQFWRCQILFTLKLKVATPIIPVSEL